MHANIHTHILAHRAPLTHTRARPLAPSPTTPTGYEGVDCSQAVPAKVAAWYPFYSDWIDRSQNNLLLRLRTQPAIDGRPPSQSVRLVADEAAAKNGGGAALGFSGGFLESATRPASRTHCSAGDKKEDLGRGREDAADAASHRSSGQTDAAAAEQQASGLPPMPSTSPTFCTTYDGAYEFAVMAWFYASEKPSNNSGITLGERLWESTISPSNDIFSWSFMLSLQGHPREDESGRVCKVLRVAGCGSLVSGLAREE